MLSRKLDDLSVVVGQLSRELYLRTGQPDGMVSRLQSIQRLLTVHADNARALEGLTVPLHARRSGELPADGNVVDLDRVRDRRRPIAGGGGAA